MKIAEPNPSRCSDDTSAAADPAIVSAAVATAHATSAPAASARGGKTEVGFTLQTLIVMAVFVLAAVGVGIGLLAVNSATSDDFEEAGQTGVEARCAPNEIWDPELESRGIGGPDSQGGIKSKQVGCEPYCGTWEFLSTGANENGEYEPAESPAAARQSSIGGPDGNGGVFSQNIGCFAPCYWSYTNGVGRPTATNGIIASDTRLQYFDDNRAPAIKQVRLGVNYKRTSSTHIRWQSDIQVSSFVNLDGKPFIIARNGRGSGVAPGTPLTPALMAELAPVFPEGRVLTVFKPNWRTNDRDTRNPVTDPGGTARNGNDWEDENWEYRADPYNKVCTIVNTTLDDQVVCSSEWDNCTTP